MAMVTVIIPMYNKGELITRAIRSIQHQTFQDFTIIVVDDGSTDNGPEIVKNINDDRITLITQPNAGPGAARNTGIKAAQTEYVSFLDADDEWYPWFLQNCIEAAEKYNVPLVATTFYRLPDNVDSTTLIAKHGINTGKHIITPQTSPSVASTLISAMHPLNTIIKTETINKYGLFYDQHKCTYGEDQLTFMRICINEPFAIIGPAAARYHCEDSQHGIPTKSQKLQPYLSVPNTILPFCPEDKKELMNSVLALRAISTATHMLQHDRSMDAAKLIRSFPNVDNHKKQYKSLMRKFSIAPIYPAYYKIKNFVRSFLSKEKPKPEIPPMPYEQDNNAGK